MMGRGKKVKYNDALLSNVDLMNWCQYLGVPLKGIFSRNEAKPLHYSPCIINLDDFGKLGTHWVCCWKGKNMEYFDSFGCLLRNEWEQELRKLGNKTFLRNNQIQWIGSVRCGYFCLLFLNERNRGTSYEDILKMFCPDVHQNEQVVKNYFMGIP